MVKRDDAMEPSQGSARDTDVSPGQPLTQSETVDLDAHEGWYKPEMGTVLVDRRPLEDEA